ncbi:MAG TPA: hypothetical protein VD907_01380 [Verrucomicrobiae bacterium]|nr:hypothetical protein [Verrucomicrobiae bacterium]
MASQLPIYLTGSYPKYGGPSAEDHLRAMLALVHNPLALGGGEWRIPQEDNWVVWQSREIHRELTGSSTLAMEGNRYADFAIRLLKGTVLTAVTKPTVPVDKPRLHYGDWALQDRKVVEAVIKQRQIDATFMRGAPSAFGLSFFSGVITHLELLERRLAEELRKMLTPDKLSATIVQFELPAELALIAYAPGQEAKRKLVQKFVQSIERVIRQLPKGTRIAFHLCWGDLKHRAVVPKPLQSLESIVLLMNGLLALPVWQQGWQLAAIHTPHCDGKNAPAEGPQTYRTFKQLEIPANLDFWMALGILHPKLSLERTTNLTGTLRELLRAQGVQHFALATPCGNARASRNELERVYGIAQEVRV